MFLNKTFTFLVDNKKTVFLFFSASSFLVSTGSHFFADDLISIGILTPRPTIGPYLKHLIDEIQEDFANSQPLKNKQKLFKAHGGAYTEHFGLNSHNIKSTILIPDFFNIRSFAEMNSDILNQIIKYEYGVVIPNEAWNSSHGKKLIESFLFSPNAKKYAIAQQLYTNTFTDKAFHAASFGLSFLVFSRFMKVLSEKNTSNLKLITGFFLSISFAFCIYIINNIFISYTSDVKALSFAVTRGQQSYNQIKKSHFTLIDNDYLEGAKEYYSKIKDRNLAIKNIFSEYKYLNIDKYGNKYNFYKYTTQPEFILKILRSLIGEL